MDVEAYAAARGPALLRLAFLLTGHAQDAEDLVQSALVDALRPTACEQGHRRLAVIPRPGGMALASSSPSTAASSATTRTSGAPPIASARSCRPP